jgi:hypothetical protein
MHSTFVLCTTIGQGGGAFKWRPGIGDPTLGGWVTVFCYFGAAVICWTVARLLSKRSLNQRVEAQTWKALMVLFGALGINKQLDLQTAFTELARVIARSVGGYNLRGELQKLFIVGVAVGCIAVSIVLWRRVADSPPATKLALLGTVAVFGYVLIRAASFHHIDRLIGQHFFGLPWNWILEIGGIVTVGVAGIWRFQTKPRRTPPVRTR